MGKIKKINVIQVNKQSTVVQIKDRCKPKKHCKPKKRFCKKKSIVVIRKAAKKVSGRIFQLCNSEPKLYFRAAYVNPSALIQIENKSDCNMLAIIHLNNRRNFTQTIEREQQVTIDVPSLKRLEIKCTGDDDTFCRGFYSLCLHHTKSKR